MDVKVIGEQDNVNVEEAMQDATEIFTVGNVCKRLGIPSSKFQTANRTSILSSGCVVPPYKQSDILNYKKLDSTYQACLDIRANTIVGLGYELRRKELTKDSELVKLLSQPNDNVGETFVQILRNMFIDLDTFYNGYFEFRKSGKTRALYYMPAKDVFIKPVVINGKATREIEKYIRIENGVRTEFLPYPSNGQTRDGVGYLIHFKRPSQESVYYGAPDNAHLFDLIRQSYLSDQYNINFFSNGGQPSWAVLITGGKLSKNGYAKIREFVENNLKGVENSHKMLFLSVPQENAKIQLLPLSKSIDEQFISLNEKTRFQIALKCHVLPKMLGISSGGNFGGGSAGMADLQLFIQTVSRPEQQYLNEVLNLFLYLEFGVNAEFVLNSMDISNEKDDAIIASIYWNMVDECGNRVTDVNEVRTNNLYYKPITLKTEPLAQPKPNTNVGTNGKVTTDGTALDEGKREDINNLDPDKNKR